MCLLLCYPSNVQPDLQHILNGIESNNDGVGFTIATKTGALITEHAIGISEKVPYEWTDKNKEKHFSFRTVVDATPMEKLAERFIKLRKRHPEGPAMFHSRMATGGVEDTRGCHPYKVGGGIKGTVLAHNGIMFSVPKGDWRSDTRIFAEDMLPVRFRKFWRPQVRDAMEKYLGAGNKIAIITVNQRMMTRTNGVPSKEPFELFIFNEELGDWLPNGSWASNGGWKSYELTYRKYDYGHGDVVGAGGGVYDSGWTGHDSDWTGYGTSSTGTGYVYGSTETENSTCVACKAVGSVDQYTEYCDICLTCNGCLMTVDDCDCYTVSGSTQPANVPAVSAHKVLPAIEAGGHYNLSPEEKRADFLRTCWGEWDNDPELQEFSYENYVRLREYEDEHNVTVKFDNADQAEEWFAEQWAIASIRNRDNAWLDSVAQATADAKKANALAMEAEEILNRPWGFDADSEPDPDDADGESGIIHRLA